MVLGFLTKSKWWKANIVAVLALLLAGTTALVGLCWHHQVAEKEAAAAAALPTASIITVAGITVNERSGQSYGVGQSPTIRFRFHPGSTGDKPLIIVNSLSLQGSQGFYPIIPASESNQCPRPTASGDYQWCGTIDVGDTKDTSMPFTVSIYGLSPQLNGTVAAVAKANMDDDVDKNHWANLPPFGDRLDQISVTRR